MRRRMALGGAVVVMCTATIVVCFALRQVNDIARSLEAAPRLSVPSLASKGSGKAQTYLLIGSDQRYDDRRRGEQGRSDTMLLVRVDPSAPQTTVLSVPRDLRTTISSPSGSRVDKINAAYTSGGAEAVVDTIQNQLGIPVNHVFEIGLGAFSAAVNTMGCSWVDVDRRYFHSNAGLPPAEQYQEINLYPGYQKLCGGKALSYVRHRHDDSDLFRSARQQEFLRSLSSGVSAGGLVASRSQFMSILRRYVRTDIRGSGEVMELIRNLVVASGKPVRQLRWPQHDAMIGGTFYLLNSEAELSSIRRQFLSLSSARRSRPPARVTKPRRGASVEPARRQTVEIARSLRAPYSVWGPTRRPMGSIYPDRSSRKYEVKDRFGAMRPAYRLVLQRKGSTFGVQGVEWLDPPILKAPHATQTVGGRRLDIYWDAKKIRLVAFRDGAWSYWVANSLDRRISNREMLATAASMRPLTKPY